MFWFIILITHYEFVPRHDLWYSRSQCNYIKPPVTRKAGLTRPIFDHMGPCILFSRNQHPRREGMKIKEGEWKLVNDHIKKFNRHILERFSPSDRICVDEIFGRWYSLGDDWFNLGLPHYV